MFAGKLAEAESANSPVLLCQRLEDLDLYGTVRGAVCTFDTLNHLSPAQLRRAIGRVALFTEEGGAFIFDINTPYKHETVLDGKVFELHTPQKGGVCLWHNSYDAQNAVLRIRLDFFKDGSPLFSESFCEYTHTLPFLRGLLDELGFTVGEVCDGESFTQPRANSRRLLISAVRRAR